MKPSKKASGGAGKQWNELTEGVLQDLDFSLDAGDVRAIIGVDAGSFQQWLTRGLLDFKAVKAGKRTFRKFHISQVPRLVLLSEIWKNGVLVSDAIEVADRILAKVNEHPYGSASGIPEAKAKKLAAEHTPYTLILWFRQADEVHFSFRGDDTARAVFDRLGYASCILISVATLKARIREAVTAARRARDAKV